MPPWTFAVEGVTSISVDTHKYAYAPKGTSLLLAPRPRVAPAAVLRVGSVAGYTMLNATTQSTRSGGPIAGTWAVVQQVGDGGYLHLAEQALEAVDAIVAHIEAEPALRLLVAPDSTLVTLATDGSCEPCKLTDELVARGWYVQPQLSFGADGPSIHLSVSAGTRPHVEELGDALRASVTAAQQAGPVAVDPEVVVFIEALGPDRAHDDDFDGLLAASGLVGASAEGDLELPTRMAEVNAMLDVASPAMREALLTAFLDRLQRPVRSPQWSALAGLVDKGLVAPDWAEALAPVDDRIAAMGQFLRDEVGRVAATSRPATWSSGRVPRPLADVRVLVVGQGPYPNPTHPIGLSFAVERHVWPLPPSLVNIYVELRATSASSRPGTATCPRGPTRG